MHDDTPTPSTDETPPDADATETSHAGPVFAATERLINTAVAFDAREPLHPSLCTGWTRASAPSHVARNADALANLLRWATSGVMETPMYPSAEARRRHRHRRRAESGGDRRRSSVGWPSDSPQRSQQCRTKYWERQIRMGAAAAGRTIPARRVLWERLKELELHHVDLDAGYTPQDWAPWFVDRHWPRPCAGSAAATTCLS